MTFVRTVKVDELPDGTIRELMIEGKAIAIANIGGKFYAINNTCLHRGGPLGQGLLEGKIVTCPWHGWQFDMINGKVVQIQGLVSIATRPRCAARTCLWTWGFSRRVPSCDASQTICLV